MGGKLRFRLKTFKMFLVLNYLGKKVKIFIKAKWENFTSRLSIYRKLFFYCFEANRQNEEF